MKGTSDWATQKRFKGQPAVLLGSLVLLMLLHPLLQGRLLLGAILEGAFSLVILSAAFAVYGQRRFFWVLAALAVPALVLGWLTRLANLPARVDEVGDGLFATLLLVVVAAMVRSLFTAGRATVDTLLRAATVYLLLGTAFAMVYGIFSREDPGTFGAAAGVFSGPDGTMNLTDLLFFSFTTLTTLGYGDITPASPVVRMVACLQAVMGPLYLAVVVARLVALYSRERPQDDDAAGRGRSEGG